MQILLCAATTFEIGPAISYIKQKKLEHKITVLITGVGLTAATYSLTKEVFNRPPQLTIQAGVAGCLTKNFELTKTVVVKNDSIGELGVFENEQFKNIFELALVENNSFPWKNEKLPNTNIDLLEMSGLEIVDSVSVQEITTDKNRIAYYKNKLGAAIETMEGAALHYVGLMENIPFLQLRSLSNYVGERDKTKWKLQESIEQLNVELKQLLIKLVGL
jgi:futalosine hydrolase